MKITIGRTGTGEAIALLVAAAAALVTVGMRDVAQRAVFTSGTDLVTVDVLVTDGHGKAVTDLGINDFQIVEKGRPQQIATFTFLSVPPVTERETDPAKLPPVRDVITNHVAPHSRAFVVLLDDLHLLPQFQERTRRVLTDILTTIPATDRVAVVFTGRSDLSIDFTTDFARQMQAVGRIRNALAFAADPTPVNCGPKEIERQHHALGTLDVLRNVITGLKQTHADERSIIYVSEGFNQDFLAFPADARRQPGGLVPSPDRTCRDGISATPMSVSTLMGDPAENPEDAQAVLRSLKVLYQTAERADVRIYTIDPRGNLPLAALFIGDVGTGYGGPLQGKVTAQNDFLRNVAEETGGIAQVTRSDLTGGVREILADTASYYLLGYRPDPLVRDGLYHELEVKVTRPGLHVRFRKGYDAPEASPKPPVPADSLHAGLTSAAADDGLPLAAFVAPIQGAGKSMKMAVTIEVLYPGPPAAPASLDDDLQYEVLRGDVEGKARVVSQHAFHFAMTATRRGDVAFLVNDTFDLPPGVANLRLGIVSKTSGRVGTLAVPVRVPNPSDDALQMPSVVLGLAVAREAVMRADAFAGLLPFQPTVSRVFSASDTLRVFAPVSWGSKETSASATLTVKGASGSAPPQSVALVQTAAAAGRHQAVLDATVPLTTLTPGDYVLAIDVRLPSGQTARREVVFAVR